MNLIAMTLALVAQSSPVSVSDRRVGDVPVKIIQVNLADARVDVGLILPQGFPGEAETFDAMVRREKPLAAINGAYFDKGTLLPIGDLVHQGELVHSGRMGTAFVFDKDRKASLQRVVRHRTMRWENAQTVLACGPALVLDGEINVDAEAEGFRDPAVLGQATRMGLGITKENKLLLVHVRKAVSFGEMAHVFKELGCRDAMNLDAGASLALFANGKTHVAPSRKLTNLLGIWVRNRG